MSSANDFITILPENASFSMLTAYCLRISWKTLGQEICQWAYHFDEFFFNITMKFIDGFFTNFRFYSFSVEELKKGIKLGIMKDFEMCFSGLAYVIYMHNLACTI